MRGLGRLLLAGLMAAPQHLYAQEPHPQAPADADAPTPAPEIPRSMWRPALYVFGTSERGTGAAYDPPLDSLQRDDAASVGLGLDVSRLLDGGRIDASVFGLAHDPASHADRGFYLAGRARGVFGPRDGAWLVRVEEAPQVQRRDTVSLSDYQRNDLWLELEGRHGGTRFGLRVGDRRRSVPEAPIQGFSRQSIIGSVAGVVAGGRQSWRLELGPQRYSTEVGDGWRIAAGLEWLTAFRRFTSALRLQASRELPLIEGGTSLAGGATAPAAPVIQPTPAPVPQPSPGPEPPVRPPTPPETPEPPLGSDPPETGQSVPDAYLVVAPPPGLLGPSRVIDPLESDENDWVFGRTQLGLVTLLSYHLSASFAATFELRTHHESGPDLTLSGPSSVNRDYFAARLTVRRELGRRAAVIVQGGWQEVRDNRPGFSYSRGIACLGLELHP